MSIKRYLLVILSVILSINGYYAYALDGWQYYRDITIDNTGNSNTLTDYQILITVDTSSLISAGKMNNDCSDIRFTENDGTTELAYWVEDGTCNSANTKIWVKVPSIPASSSYIIKMWYGNAGATSVSSIDNTFIFGDDFNDGTLDWTIALGSGVVEENGYVKVYYDGGTTYYRSDLISVGSNSFIVTAKVKKVNSGVDNNILIANSDRTKANAFYITGDTINLKYYNGGSIDTGYDQEDNVWVIHHFKFRNLGSDVLWTAEGIMVDLDASRTDGYALDTSDLLIEIESRNTAGNEIYLDYIFIRKYTSPEPSTSVGEEQVAEQNVPIIITNIENKTYYTSYLNITYYATDVEDAIFTLKAWFDDVLIYENETYLNGTILQYNINLLSEGQHNFTLFAVDQDGGVSYKEVIFTIEDYELIDYYFDKYQYEDEKYNYSIKLKVNRYLFNEDNVSFNVENYSSIRKYILGKEHLEFDNTCTAYEGQSCDGFYVIDGLVKIEDGVLRFIGDRDYTYSYGYDYSVEKNIEATYISFDYYATNNPRIEIYQGDTLLVQETLYGSGNFKYYNEEGFDKIIFKRSCEICETTYIDNFTVDGILHYIYEIENTLIMENSTAVHFSFEYSKDNVNETIFSNTTTLMWGYYLIDINFPSKVLEGSVSNITYNMFCIHNCNKYSWIIKTHITNITGQNTEKILEVSNSFITTYDVDAIDLDNASVEADGDKYQDREITGELIIGNSTRPLGSNITTRVYGLYVRKCASDYPHTLTYTIYDEREGTLINDAVAESVLTVSTENVERSFSFLNNLSTGDNKLCLVSSENLSYSITGLIRYYDAAGNYFPRSFIINKTEFYGSIPLNLYLLKYVYGANTIIYVVDSDNQPIPNVLVKIQKYYVANNSYVTVTQGYTDYNGMYSTYLEPYTTYYKFIIEHSGRVLKETSAFTISCDVSSTCPPYTLTFQVNLYDLANIYTYLSNIAYSCWVENEYLKCTVSDTSGIMQSAQLLVQKITDAGRFEVCEVKATSSASTLVCEVNNLTTTQYYYVLKATLNDGSTVLLDSNYLGKSRKINFGIDGVILTLIMTLVAVALSYYNISIMILSLVTIIAFSALLGIINVSIAGVISLILAGLFVIYKVR